MVEAGVLTPVVIWLVVPVALGCFAVVVGIVVVGVVAPVEVLYPTLVVGANPKTLLIQKKKKNYVTYVTNKTAQLIF